MDYFVVVFNIWYNFWLKSSFVPKSEGHCENVKLFQVGSFSHRIKKDFYKSSQKKNIFEVDDVPNDVTAWRQSWIPIAVFE